MHIAFNKPVYLPEHESVFRESLRSGEIAGNGPFTKKCETILEQSLAKPTRFVTSATHALEMMGLLANLESGDEVIMPSFTFVSTANAFALRGAHLRFADCDRHGNIKASEVERLLSKKTKAVLAMDYAGGSPDLDALLALCRSAPNQVLLFEDAAQSIHATYRGRPLGTIADLGCFSFHETKNATSGEGGAIILGSERFLDRAEILREKGTNRRQFLQGLVDKYTWVDVGSSYVQSDLNAAYLYPQLLRIEEITAKRLRIYERYRSELGDALAKAGVEMLEVPEYNEGNGHIFGLIFPSFETRNVFIADMKTHDITCPFHYVSLHLSPVGLKFSGGKPDKLPMTERLSQCLVRLPIFFNMTDEEQSYVVDKVRAHLGKMRGR